MILQEMIIVNPNIRKSLLIQKVSRRSYSCGGKNAKKKPKRARMLMRTKVSMQADPKENDYSKIVLAIKDISDIVEWAEAKLYMLYYSVSIQRTSNK